MAYHHNKIARGFQHLINVFGADHVGYITRMKAAVAALSDGKVDLDIKVCQLVRLFRAGEPVRMSKRAGTFVTLRDVVDEVGPRSRALHDALSQERCAARLRPRQGAWSSRRTIRSSTCSTRTRGRIRCSATWRRLFHRLTAEVAGSRANADLSPLKDAGEIDLIRKLAAFPVVVEGAARAHEPHRLAFYLYDLASAFHAQWTKGNELPHLRFIQASDGTLTAARLALIRANAQVLATGLALLGVHAPEEMR